MIVEILLSIVAGVVAVLEIRAAYKSRQRQIYLFKPLATVLITLIAGSAPAIHGRHYQALVVAGLLCSLAGDIFLMLPADRFLPGLLSFLLAHLCYSAAFSEGTALITAWWLLLPLALYSALLYALLRPHLGSLQLPVLAYQLIILGMVWRALERWVQIGTPSGLLAAWGAILFVLSDSALALDRFRSPHRATPLVVLSTYYAAQWLIALSANAL